MPLLDLFRTLHGAFCTGARGAAAAAGPADAEESGPQAAAAAAAAGSAAARAALGAVPLEGLYTDGGMDMGDPAFWVRGRWAGPPGGG